MKTKIAVFDHSPHLQLLFRHILTNRGYAVFTLEEDESGLQKVEALQPDLIILGNIRSSHESDFRFLINLRAQSATKTTPVVVATTAAPHLLKSPSLEQVTNVSILFKPFNQEQLLTCVEGGLKGRQQDREQGSPQYAFTATSYC
jgi:twitching motility two-component system response regulator PilH